MPVRPGIRTLRPGVPNSQGTGPVPRSRRLQKKRGLHFQWVYSLYSSARPCPNPPQVRFLSSFLIKYQFRMINKYQPLIQYSDKFFFESHRYSQIILYYLFVFFKRSVGGFRCSCDEGFMPGNIPPPHPPTSLLTPPPSSFLWFLQPTSQSLKHGSFLSY